MRSSSPAALRPSLTLLAALALAAAGVFAQTAPQPDPPAPAANADTKLLSFEVASIRPAESGIAGFYTYPGGRMKCEICLLDWLIRFAFNVEDPEIIGEPDWGHRDRYSIEAIPPESSESRKFNPSHPTQALTDEQREMIRSLLIERFQFKYHRESRTGPVYVLTRGKGQLKLSPPKDASASPGVAPTAGDGLWGRNASISDLAACLSTILYRPVIDNTGLKGAFDFNYEAGGDDQDQDYIGIVNSILKSVQGLGLELKSVKAPVETIVIDHIERPSPN